MTTPTITGQSTISGSSSGIAINGFTVADIDNPASLKVHIKAENGTLALSTTTGITGYTSAKELTFSGSITDLNNALNSLTYQPDSGFSGTDALAIAVSDDNGTTWQPYKLPSAIPADTYFNYSNGHYYKYVNSSATWENAQTAATGSTLYGASGYLVTITSQDESDFLRANGGSNGWFGAKYVSGTWKWDAGPEAGQTLSYNRWHSGEPNGSGSEYAYLYNRLRTSPNDGLNGDWYDEGGPASYIVEYGGLNTDTPQTALVVTVVPNAAPTITSLDTGYKLTPTAVDGTNDYIDLPDLAQGVLGTNFTLEGWVNVSSVGSWARLFDFGNGAGSDNVLLALSNGSTGKVAFEIYQGSSSEPKVTANTALPLNQWVHVAVSVATQNSTSTATIYQDGIQVAQGTVKTPNDLARTSNYIGRSNWNGDAYTDARIKDVRVWTETRSASDILDNMNAATPTDANSKLYARYKFDATSGTTATDSATGTHLGNGTTYNGNWLSGSTNLLNIAGFEGSATTVNTFQITDSDIGGGNAIVTLSTDAGATLTLSTSVLNGITAGQIANNGTNSVTITAPLSAINATIAGNGLSLAGSVTNEAATTHTITIAVNDQQGASNITNTLAVVVSPMMVTTQDDSGDDATVSTYATDLVDGDGLSLREALHHVGENGVIRFAATVDSITLNNDVNVKAGVTLNSDTTGTLTLAGGTLNLAGTLNITNETEDNLTISSVIAGANGSVVKNGAGSLTLSGTNTYTGTTVVSQGTITVSSDANLGTDYVQVGGGLEGILQITQTGSFDNVIMVADPYGLVMVDAGAIVTLTGKLDENPDGNGNDLIKMGGGTLILASPENEAGLSGDIYVLEGDVEIADDDSLPAGEIYFLTNDKELEFRGDTNTEINNALNLNGNAKLNVGSADKVVTISGAIKGTAGFAKEGNGTLKLTNDNPFSGVTTINSGAVILNGKMPNTATVTVNGKLGGSGEIGLESNNGAVTVSSTGTLAAGNSPGILTLRNGLELQAGAKLDVELNGAVVGTEYDQIVVKGRVTLTNSTLVLHPAASLANGITFKIIDNDGTADLVAGTFSGLSEGATMVTANGKHFTISYKGGDGNDVTLTSFTPPEPEPDPVPTPTPKPVPTPAPVFEKPVSKEVESQVPTAKNSNVKGDGNGDGIADINQKNVISLPTQKDLTNTKDAPKVFLSIELPTGQTLTKAEVKTVAEAIKEKPITFVSETVNDKGEKVAQQIAITQETAPFGLFEFNFAGVPTTTDLSGNLKGGTTPVKLYLDDNQTVEKYLKQTISGTWETIPFSYAYDEKLGKTVVSISLTDGDKFDLDGKIDGRISDPGTPIIVPKLAVAPEPVKVQVLSEPKTQIYVGYDRLLDLNEGAARIFGTSAIEILQLGSNASNVRADQNIERLNLPNVQTDYSFEQFGNVLQIAKGSVMIAQAVIQDDDNGTLLYFSDASVQSVKLNAGKIEMKPYILQEKDIPKSLLNSTKFFTVSGENVTVNSENIDVFGSINFDAIKLAGDASKVTVNQNIEELSLPEKLMTYHTSQTGNVLNLSEGEQLIASVVVQDDTDGTRFNFVDGSYKATFVLPTQTKPLSIELTGIPTV